jgi:hypothetical protein
MSKLKISKARFNELRAAIEVVGGIPKDSTVRQRWDALWASGYNSNLLYNEGLNDTHIDSALRKISE